MRKVYSNILFIAGWLFLTFSFYLFLLAFIEISSLYIGASLLILGLISLFVSKRLGDHSGNMFSLFTR
ncbi:hypothetical protein WQ54_17050 [Bacillus sp. SA1-12]|uniref:hypothetical protein n=1 Tax=Bacillus sp. SA1-12 TaxID=1455638 RepID=UPI0006270090|nr:hypothetical protein [Bacillus sp. SA1-12]KKI91029.1 hypothetical protein WQ54_17050 [Bacillus sp. SA1-12]